jgi:predicted RecB family endonuclease
MLITLNDLGKFLYLNINRLSAAINDTLDRFTLCRRRYKQTKQEEDIEAVQVMTQNLKQFAGERQNQ